FVLLVRFKDRPGSLEVGLANADDKPLARSGGTTSARNQGREKRFDVRRPQRRGGVVEVARVVIRRGGGQNSRAGRIGNRSIRIRIVFRLNLRWVQLQPGQKL